MDVLRLLNLSVVVTHVTVDDDDRDEFGNPTETTTETTYRGYHWQGTTSERTGGAEVFTEKQTLVLEPSAAGAVDNGDRVTIEGVPYVVDGDPWEARNARTTAIEYVTMPVARSG